MTSFMDTCGSSFPLWWKFWFSSVTSERRKAASDEHRVKWISEVDFGEGVENGSEIYSSGRENEVKDKVNILEEKNKQFLNTSHNLQSATTYSLTSNVPKSLPRTLILWQVTHQSPISKLLTSISEHNSNL